MYFQDNLELYVQQIFKAIVYSGLNCPIVMCEIFFALKEAALKHFPGIYNSKFLVYSFFLTKAR